MVLTVAHGAIILIVVLAIVGILLVVARQAGVSIPPWVVTICWILLAAVVGVFAIKLLVSVAW